MVIPISAQVSPLFQPAMRQITAVTNAYPALVTTSFAHNYPNGTVVRLNIPPYFGMLQANSLTGTITNNGNPSQFLIDINTTTFSPFVIPFTSPTVNWWYNINANCVAIGEDNNTLQAAEHNSMG